MAIKGAHQRLAGKLLPRDVRTKGGRVDVDRVSAGRFHDLHAAGHKPFAEVRHAPQPVLEVMLVQHFLKTLGHRFEVPPGKAAVGREAFGQNQAGCWPDWPERRRGTGARRRC